MDRHLARTERLRSHISCEGGAGGIGAGSSSARDAGITAGTAAAAAPARGAPPHPAQVLILGCVGWCSDPDGIAMHVSLLRSKMTSGATVESRVIGDTDVPTMLRAASAVVCLQFSSAESGLLEHVGPLTLVQCAGAGTDRIDFASLEAHPQLAVCNCAGHENAMAEYCMLGMLHHAHDFNEATRSFKSGGSWRMSGRNGGPLHRELSSATVGILGLGLVGQALAVRAAAFGMRVLGCNRTARAVVGQDGPVYPLSEMGAMAAECDYLVLTAALAPETEGILSDAVLRRMKSDAVVLNVGRAGLVDERALYTALESGAIGGAMLDVWWQYPTPDDPSPRPSSLPYHELPPSTVMTPHASAWTREMLDRRWDTIAENCDSAVAATPSKLKFVIKEAGC